MNTAVNIAESSRSHRRRHHLRLQEDRRAPTTPVLVLFLTGLLTFINMPAGTLFGQPVLIVATNEGELNSGLCTQEVLQCGPYIKEFIWSGEFPSGDSWTSVVKNLTCRSLPLRQLFEVL